VAKDDGVAGVYTGVVVVMPIGDADTVRDKDERAGDGDEEIAGLGCAMELVQDDGAVDLGIGVGRVDSEGFVEQGQHLVQAAGVDRAALLHRCRKSIVRFSAMGGDVDGFLEDGNGAVEVAEGGEKVAETEKLVDVIGKSTECEDGGRVGVILASVIIECDGSPDVGVRILHLRWTGGTPIVR